MNHESCAACRRGIPGTGSGPNANSRVLPLPAGRVGALGSRPGWPQMAVRRKLPSQQSGCIRFGGCAPLRSAAHPDSGWGADPPGEPMPEPDAKRGRPQNTSRRAACKANRTTGTKRGNQKKEKGKIKIKRERERGSSGPSRNKNNKTKRTEQNRTTQSRQSSLRPVQTNAGVTSGRNDPEKARSGSGRAQKGNS